jgi:hypothetical protein
MGRNFRAYDQGGQPSRRLLTLFLDAAFHFQRDSRDTLAIQRSSFLHPT